MNESSYELPIEKPVVYALASLCVATYVNGGVPVGDAPNGVKRKQQLFLRLMGKLGKGVKVTWRVATFVPRKMVGLFRKSEPPKRTSDYITNDTKTEIRKRFEEPFQRLDWKVPPATDIETINHRYQEKGAARLGGFAVATKEYIAVAFRGTAYSEEWVANISYGVPAVQSVRQVSGVITLSLFPFLKNKLVERVFDLPKAKRLNAGYLEHVNGMVAQTKIFLDKIIKEEEADPQLRNRPLYFTGHSLGGAAALITSGRIWEDEKRDYKDWFASRIKVVTFGAPPISAVAIAAASGDPPIFNLLRPGDVVPAVSLDLLGIPLLNRFLLAVPGTPHHRGEHYIISDDGKAISIRQQPYKRKHVFRSVRRQFFVGMRSFHAVRDTMGCHYMPNYAKDLECLVFPGDCRKWKASA